ncbi:MAG: hypothetical protein WC575_02510 [Patescibacteria group bacterium]
MKKSIVTFSILLLGVMLLGASCSKTPTQQKPVKQNDNNTSVNVSSNTNQPLVGNNEDEHGCIGSAGYSWCEQKQKCLRVWEEKCNNVSDINLKDYSLINYPLKQSPIYNQLDKSCYEDYWSDAEDTKLVKNKTEILIPSLLQLISSGEKEKPSCAMYIELFSAPSDGKYLYFKTAYHLESDVPYSGINAIYSLDLSNLTIKELAVSNFIATYDLYRGWASDSYKILADGKRLIKWDMNGVYIINLETDSKNNLFVVKENQWLISNITFGMGQNAEYNIKVNGNQIIIGIYDKTKTQSGYPIIVSDRNVDVQSDTWNYEEDIKPKFIAYENVLIPNN